VPPLLRSDWNERSPERRILAAADEAAPTATLGPRDQVGLGSHRAAALVMTAGSGRRVNVLVGPAGEQ